jgi:hypothetical protein
MQLKGLLICMPAYGHQNYMEATQSLYHLGQWLATNRIPSTFSAASSSVIEETRNLFLTLWYDGWPDTYSHLLMVDADMEFPWELIRDMIAFERDVVGCIYGRRSMPAVAVGRAMTDGEAQYNPSDAATRKALTQGFIPMAGVGAGVILISREAVRQILIKFPEICDHNLGGYPDTGKALLTSDKKRLIRAFDPMWIDEPDGSKTKLSEDLAFCERWRRCGGTVWANVNYVIGHMGPHNFSIRYADYLEKKAAEAKLAPEDGADGQDEATKLEAAAEAQAA